MTTHYIEEAERICDRIAFYSKGEIVRMGTVTELMESVEHEYRIKLQLDSSIIELKEELENNFQAVK